MEYVKKLFTFIIVAAVLLAVLQLFGGDPIKLISFIIAQIWHWIITLRDTFLSFPWFRGIFGKH